MLKLKEAIWYNALGKPQGGHTVGKAGLRIRIRSLIFYAALFLITAAPRAIFGNTEFSSGKQSKIF